MNIGNANARAAQAIDGPWACELDAAVSFFSGITL